MTDPVRWYNFVAPLYDLSVRGVYTKARQETVRQLRLSWGMTVLDLACGTGENFPILLESVGPSGRLIGSDYSAGMLAQAQKKVDRRAWKNVNLVHADARELSIESIQATLSLSDLRVDRIVCTLGYSVMPDWQTIFDRTWAILEPGGRYAIMDWHSPKKTLLSWIINKIAASEIERRWWLPLESLATDYEKEVMFRGMVFVLSGSKPGN